ncbi:MAG TPA: phosphoribosylanthranilate isomerase [Nitrospiraceae bacterium]|jgi:phosphoribosylanthranilate isomerase|nr:phosphoribosylanthranilate isomerase [Nitrospiraceae bacterium]
MVKIKICGITNIDDALAAVEFGADALGFVFYKESPRHISPDEAKNIIRKLPPFVTSIGVFVNESREVIEKIVRDAPLSIVQLHGSEPPEACAITERVIKAIRVKDLSDLEPLNRYRVSAFLLDTYAPESLGGTGQIFNWDIAVDAKRFGRIILAGGLNPDNVVKAVQRVRPYGVDVSSGTEQKKGRKDHVKMKLFIDRAKGA